MTELGKVMSDTYKMSASRLLIAAGLLALLTACESLPDERALAVNDPAFDPASSEIELEQTRKKTK
jgi:hypothetical protein